MFDVILIIVMGAVLAGILLLTAWRSIDHRNDRAEMTKLKALQPDNPETFSLSMVDHLPEAARRYFTYAIREGTPLLSVAELTMRGRFGMGDKSDPKYLTMEAKQVLAAPHGFVWKMQAGKGLMRLSGSDSASWTRFWLAGLIPVARLGGDRDHQRSAFGRYIAEATFWTPAALLPRPEIDWQAVDENTARVVVTHRGLEQAVDLTIDDRGKPQKISFMRWSNANPDGVFRLQPFGGYLSEFRDIEGFCVPTHIEAGNFFGTDAYFPFFIADISDVTYPVENDAAALPHEDQRQ